MILQNLIKTFEWKQIKDKMIELYPDQESNIDGYKKVFEQLNTCIPSENKENMIIFVEYIEKSKFNDEPYYAVFGKNGKMKSEDTSIPEEWKEQYKDNDEEITWALGLSSFNEWAGYDIKDSCFDNYTGKDIICHCLFEMTFFGFDNKSIQETKDDLDKRVEEVDNGTTKYVSWEKLREDLEEKIKQKD